MKRLKIEEPLDADPQFDVIITAEDREVKQHWQRYSITPKVYEYVIEFSPTVSENRAIQVSFPRRTDNIIYSPALLENEIVEYSLEEFGFQEIFLPLANGLVGIGNDAYIIKDTSTIHVAGKIFKESNLHT